jgi:hypothetical protein
MKRTLIANVAFSVLVFFVCRNLVILLYIEQQQQQQLQHQQPNNIYLHCRNAEFLSFKPRVQKCICYIVEVMLLLLLLLLLSILLLILLMMKRIILEFKTVL